MDIDSENEIWKEVPIERILKSRNKSIPDTMTIMMIGKSLKIL